MTHGGRTSVFGINISSKGNRWQNFGQLLRDHEDRKLHVTSVREQLEILRDGSKEEQERAILVLSDNEIRKQVIGEKAASLFNIGAVKSTVGLQHPTFFVASSANCP